MMSLLSRIRCSIGVFFLNFAPIFNLPTDDKSYLSLLKNKLLKRFSAVSIVGGSPGLKILNTSKSNLSWAFAHIKKILNKHYTGEYILLFPFCSKKHQKKKWPYFQELVVELKIIATFAVQTPASLPAVVVVPKPTACSLINAF